MPVWHNLVVHGGSEETFPIQQSVLDIQPAYSIFLSILPCEVQ